MKWFKHQSDMRNDPKIKRLIRRHGANGYAVYCYIIEAISGRLSSKKPIPDLEETPEDISYDLNIELNIVTEIINSCLEQKLFFREPETGIILCYKIFKFLDDTTRKQTEVTKLLKEAEEKGYLSQGLISFFPSNKKNIDELQVDDDKSEKVRVSPSKSEDVRESPSKSEDVRESPSKSEDVRQTPIKSGKVRLEEEEEKEKEYITDSVPKSGIDKIPNPSEQKTKTLKMRSGEIISGEEAEDFSAVWEKFTNKIDKQDCLEIFIKLRRSKEWSDDIQKKLLSGADYFEKQNASYDANRQQKPYTFFNKERWRNKPPEEKPEGEINVIPMQNIEMSRNTKKLLKEEAGKCRKDKSGCQGHIKDKEFAYRDPFCKCGHCEVVEDLDLNTYFTLDLVGF